VLEVDKKTHFLHEKQNIMLPITKTGNRTALQLHHSPFCFHSLGGSRLELRRSRLSQ